MNQDTEIKVTRTLRRASQRERLVLAMLEQPSLAKAANSIGVSNVTAWRITKTPEFLAEYRQARSDTVLQAHARLQQASNAAATTVLKMMLDPKAPAGTRLRAAEQVLERASAGFALEDLAARVRQLEETAAAKDKRPQK